MHLFVCLFIQLIVWCSGSQLINWPVTWSLAPNISDTVFSYLWPLCFSFCGIAVLVTSDEPHGNWPGTGAVRGRRSPGHGYGREQNVFQCTILLKFIDFSDACDIICLSMLVVYRWI